MKIKYEYIVFPGLHMDDIALAKLVQELKAVAATCFEEIPSYQALTGQRNELERCLIVLARDENKKLLAFCSSPVLDIGGVGKVLHLGLICVRPECRGFALTHKLISRVAVRFVRMGNPFRKVWMTNITSIPSSLINVGKHFENVYPSIAYPKGTDAHKKIALEIDKKYRSQMYINDESVYDEKESVFRFCSNDTVFEHKDLSDFKIKDRKLADFYLSKINLQDGDEILQVGQVSAFTGVKHFFKRLFK